MLSCQTPIWPASRNMGQNIPQSIRIIKFGYVNLDLTSLKRRRIKLPFIVFLENSSGISEAAKVTSGICVIVGKINLLRNRYSFFAGGRLLTIATSSTWLYCRRTVTKKRGPDWFGGWIYGIGCNDRRLGIRSRNWTENGGVGRTFLTVTREQKDFRMWKTVHFI